MPGTDGQAPAPTPGPGPARPGSAAIKRFDDSWCSDCNIVPAVRTEHAEQRR